MSAFDKPPSFYQHQDITDPTPYEDDDTVGDMECEICNEPVRRGEDIILIHHINLRDLIAVHYRCLSLCAECNRMTVGDFCDMLEDLGFATEEGDEV